MLEPIKNSLPNVLIVDDEQQWRDLFARNLQMWGYCAVVAEGVGSALVQDAIEKAMKYRCEIALVDKCLLDDDGHDNSGLDMLELLKPTLSIVVSAYGSVATVAKVLTEKTAYDYIGKEEGPDRLRRALERAADEIALLHPPSIQWPDSLGTTLNGHFGFMRDEGRQEVERTLARLFARNRTLKLELVHDLNQLNTMAPRSRAVILKVTADHLEPKVVKIARAERIQAEIERYKKYIKDQLGGNFYARLEDWVVLWNWGTAVYTFQGNINGPLQTFSHYYRTGSVEEIKETLTQFFCETWSNHYARKEKRDASLFEAYTGVWEKDWHERLRDFPEKSEQMNHPLLACPLLNPVQWLIRHIAFADATLPDRSYFPETWEAITHGDLQGDNMLVGNVANRIRAIDYERSGPGPAFQDFVELEIDILTRLIDIPFEQMDEYYELVKVIVNEKKFYKLRPHHVKSPQAKKALKVIQAIREIVHGIFVGIEVDIDQYRWGLLLNAVFRATLLWKQQKEPTESPKPEYWRALLVGSVLCEQLLKEKEGEICLK